MSAITCDWCGSWIDYANHRHPGFCSPHCRDRDRAARESATRERQLVLRARRQTRAERGGSQ